MTKLRCSICDHAESPRHIIQQLTEDVQVQDCPKLGLWFLVEKGQPLCLIHPRLDARFKPAEAMTPANPRWQEFYKRLEGPEGCNARPKPSDCRPTGREASDGETIWDCKGGNDQSFSRKILAAMGFTPELIDASCRYFSSHGGFCDCEVLFNVNPRPVRSRSGKNPRRKR